MANIHEVQAVVIAYNDKPVICEKITTFTDKKYFNERQAQARENMLVLFNEFESMKKEIRKLKIEISYMKGLINENEYIDLLKEFN